MTVRDLKLESTDDGPDVTLSTDTGDLELVSGDDNIEQSVALLASVELRDLIGQPFTNETLSRVEAAIEDALRRDPQVERVDGVAVTSVDDDTAEVRVVTAKRDYTIPITV